MSWEDRESNLFTRNELETLRRLRGRFLDPEAGHEGYWHSANELGLYDRTFGERIGWKWDAVLGEIALRGWQPRSRTLVDWGCGSGIASRRVMREWPRHFSSVLLHDTSTLARDFAREAVGTAFPEIPVQSPDAGTIPPGSLVLLSHVLNELTEVELVPLIEQLRQADEVLWVESSTHANSRRFTCDVRQRLLAGGLFSVVGPCTHRELCGMLMPENERHWCHSFVSPPSEVFQHAGWAQFAKELGIDLRAVPYSFLALRKVVGGEPPAFAPPDSSRVIGRSRDYKGYSKVLSCEASGVHEWTLQKRDAPALLKSVQRGEELPIYRWQLSASGKIVGGEHFDAKSSSAE